MSNTLLFVVGTSYKLMPAGDKVTTFMGKQRLQSEDYMKTKFDENGNAIK